MSLARRALAAFLCAALAVQPAFAAVQSAVSGSVPAVSVVAPLAGNTLTQLPALPLAGLSAPLLGAGLDVRTLTLPPLASGASVSATLPSAAGATSLTVPAAASAFVRPGASRLTLPAGSEKSTAAQDVARIAIAADKAVEGVSRASGPQASAQAGDQFSQLTGELTVRPTASELGAPVDGALGSAGAPLAKPTAASGNDKSSTVEPPQPPAPKKAGFFQVFRDPARNRAFWRYVSGYSLFLFGFEMYVVGMPYLISSLTTNSLKEHKDARAGNAEAVKELIRSNRSLSRIAHWAAQGLSYIAIPLFTRNVETDGPRKWLVRSMLLRAAALAGVPLLFFATGLVSLPVAMWILFGLVAAQSFFQGVSVTTEGAATTKMLGDKSVTPEERTRANSVLTVVGAIIAIIGPVVAGQIAGIGPVLGKGGVGGAVIYGIYAGVMALTGLIYATIKMFGGKGKDSVAAGTATATTGPPAEAAPKGLGGTLKSLWASIKDGTRMMWKDRLLRTMVLLSTVSALFSDPLVFNVLPEYVEGLVAKNPGTLGALMNVPGVGWFLKTLVATPMGNFALMVVMASVGSIVAAALMKPLTRLFTKLGFKTDEALTIPFYFIAALEFPLFLLMISMPTMFGAVALYGLQALSVGFIGIAIQGLYQKNLGSRKDGDVNKILAADSLVGIAAAIVSTVVYGFILTGIAIHTSMIIAAVATGAVALLRLAAPFLSFTKSQRRPPPPPPQDQPPAEPEPVPPAHAMPSTGDHNGPNSILSTHL
jgi:MFS family permease